MTLLCLQILHCHVLTVAKNRELTTNVRVFLLKCWWKTNKHSDEVSQLFVERNVEGFPQTLAPPRQGV